MDDLFKEINTMLVVAVRADRKHRRQTAGLCRTITHRFKLTDIKNFGGVRHSKWPKFNLTEYIATVSVLELIKF